MTLRHKGRRCNAGDHAEIIMIVWVMLGFWAGTPNGRPLDRSQVYLGSWTIHSTRLHSPLLFHRPYGPYGPGSVVGIATGYGLDDPGIESRWGVRFPAPVQTGPEAHPVSCTVGTGSFPGVKSGRGVTLTPHPLLVPWSRKSRAIPLLPLWAVRPVQGLSACTRTHFTFTFTTVHAGLWPPSGSISRRLYLQLFFCSV